MRELAPKFSRFCLVGTVATVLHFVILIAGVRLVGVDAVIASSAGYVMETIASHALNYGFTHRSMRPLQEAVPRLILVPAIGSAALMAIQINLLGVRYLAAQILADRDRSCLALLRAPSLELSIAGRLASRCKVPC